MNKRPLVVISSLLALLAGCGGKVSGQQSEPETASQPLSSQCTSATASGGWLNGSLGSHAGPFTVSLQLSTAVAPSDALFGLSHGPAATYTDLAGIVRFNPRGFIDVRNGGAYMADQSWQYNSSFGEPISINIDPAAHRYSVSDGFVQLATNYAFRSEQANTSVIDHFALKVDAGGPLSACGLTVTDGCRTAAPGGAFVNDSFFAQSTFLTASFTVTPNANGIDGVVGLSAGSAANFNDLAAAVRLNPDGHFDARNGDSYAADESLAYTAGSAYAVELLVDLVAHSYTVIVNSHVLAHDYAFRSQQAQVTSLANWAVIADSPAGSLQVCSFFAQGSQGAKYLHDLARYGSATAMAPAANGGLILSGADHTLILDANGLQLGTLAHGGAPAEDAGNDLYLAGSFAGSYDGDGGALTSAGGSDVYVSKYDGAQQQLWSHGFGTAADDAFGGLRVNAEGDALVVAGTQLIRLDASGATRWTLNVDPSVGLVDDAVDATGGAFLLQNVPNQSAVTLTHVSASGSPQWTKTISESGAQARFIAGDPGGNAILTGVINGSIDFGGGHVLRATSSEGERQVFISKFTASSGDFVWVTLGEMNQVRSLVVDAQGRAVISGFWENGVRYALNRINASGALELAVEGQTLLSPTFELGIGGSVAVDPAGSIYWQFSVNNPQDSGFGYLARLQP